MLVLMMLTATTAWAFKTETATYTVTYSGGTITIKNGSTNRFLDCQPWALVSKNIGLLTTATTSPTV